MKPIFFYGSLRDQELLEVVLGRQVGPDEFVPALVRGFRPRRIVNQAYPMLVADPEGAAEGMLFRVRDGADLARLAFFEEAEYGLAPVTAETGGGTEEAEYFRATGKLLEGGADWDFAIWQRDDRVVAIEAARELMHHYGRLHVDDIDTIWFGIMRRARQKARAKAAEPVMAGLRTAFGRDDVVWEDHDRAYTSFLAVEEHQLRHRRFDGGWTGSLSRCTVAWGDAVTVLPYDPRTGRVLLIEQFRAGPAARGDKCPWCLEVIAGLVDADENAEATARREAREEAGIGIGRLVEIPGFYTSAGLSCEFITAFVGEADLDGAGGIHGLAAEGENIRAMTVPLDEALAALDAGAVTTSPAVISLLWLARERDRLAAAWG